MTPVATSCSRRWMSCWVPKAPPRSPESRPSLVIEWSSETTPGTAPGELGSLRGQLTTLKVNYAQLATTLGANNPRMVAMREQMAEITKQIDTEQNRMKVQARENFHAAQGTENATQKELDAKKQE